jgi:hypothetical protein
MAITDNQGCTTPDQIWPIESEQQAAEREIERIIATDFRTSAAARGAIDIFFDPGTDGPQVLTDWISGHSFGRVIDRKKMMRGFLAGDYAVPDIITSRGSVAKSEFYEIKPNSDNGRRLAARKVVDFERLNRDFGLLFFAGVDYDPHGSQFTRILTVGLVEYELTLKWWRAQPGVILYEICYRIRSKQDVKVPFFLLVLLGLLLLLLLKGEVPEGFTPTPPIMA